MKLTIPATFDGKVFIPDAPVPGVPAGTQLTLTAETGGPVPLPPLSPETAHLWRAELEKEYIPEPGEETLLELIDRVAVDDPDTPTDLAAQHDHYLYGTPKR